MVVNKMENKQPDFFVYVPGSYRDVLITAGSFAEGVFKNIKIEMEVSNDGQLVQVYTLSELSAAQMIYLAKEYIFAILLIKSELEKNQYSVEDFGYIMMLPNKVKLKEKAAHFLRTLNISMNNDSAIRRIMEKRSKAIKRDLEDMGDNDEPVY